MNNVIILSGGSGVRMGSDVPKQYIIVNSKPIIYYCYNQFLLNEKIDGIVIVANDSWHSFIGTHLDIKNKKFLGFAKAGSSRQESVLNGLTVLKKFSNEDDIVLIHDAARPNITQKMICDCLEMDRYDGIMPALPCKDTLYMSNDGKTICSLLNRDLLYAGQSPESFRFGKYYEININTSMKE